MDTTSNPVPMEDRHFDRLVDGELNEEERRGAVGQARRRAGWLAALRLGVSGIAMLAASVGSCRARKCSGRAGTRRKSSFPVAPAGLVGLGGDGAGHGSQLFPDVLGRIDGKASFLGRPVTPPGTPASSPTPRVRRRRCQPIRVCPPSQFAPQPQPSWPACCRRAAPPSVRGGW